MLNAVLSILDRTDVDNTASSDTKTHDDHSDSVRFFGSALIYIHDADLELHKHFRDIGAHPGGITAAVSSIVSLIGRLHVIQDSKFISAGYALVDGIVLLVFLLMTTSNWPSDSPDTLGEGVAFTVVAGYIYSYIRILIGDLESPFDYAEEYCSKCYKAGRLLGYSGPGPDDKEQTWFSRLRGEFEFGGSLKGTAMLTVVFGTQLKQLMERAQPQDTSAAEQKPDRKEKKEDQHVKKGARLPFFKHRPYRQMHKSLRKWRLVIRSLPFVVALVGCRLAVWYGAGIGGWIDSPQLFTSFIRLVIFVSSVVIQGLMQDYKESEHVPSELAAAFYGLTTTSLLCKHWADFLSKRAPTNEGSEEPIHKVRSLLDSVLGAIQAMSSGTKKCDRDKGYLLAMGQITDLNKELHSQFLRIDWQFDPKGYKLSPPEKHFQILRYVLTRMYMIQSTGYIAEAYTLMDLMVLWIFGVLTATYWPLSLNSDGVPAAAAFTIVIPFLFSYIEVFVRNIEDPFDYSKEHLRLCYNKDGRAPMSLGDDQLYGGSIDMAPLTIGFGKLLRRNVNDELDVDLKKPPTNQVCCSCTLELPSFVEILRRFRLVLHTSPFITIMVGLRLAVWYGAGVGGWIDPSVPLSFVGVAIFVTGFLLQAVIQDYRDAEKLPCQVAVALKGIMAVVSGGGDGEHFGAKFGHEHEMAKIDARKAYSKSREAVEQLLAAGLGVLGVQEGTDPRENYNKELAKVDSSVFKICSSFSYQKPAKKPADGNRRKICDTAWEVVGQVSDLRRALVRARQIKQENFNLDGYTLMDAIVLAVCVLLTLTDWPHETHFGTAIGATIVISGLFIYMAMMIRSLENPYHYPKCEPKSDCLIKSMDNFTVWEALVYGNPVDLCMSALFSFPAVSEPIVSSFHDSPSRQFVGDSHLLPLPSRLSIIAQKPVQATSSPSNCTHTPSLNADPSVTARTEKIQIPGPNVGGNGVHALDSLPVPIPIEAALCLSSTEPAVNANCQPCTSMISTGTALNPSDSLSVSATASAATELNPSDSVSASATATNTAAINGLSVRRSDNFGLWSAIPAIFPRDYGGGIASAAGDETTETRSSVDLVLLMGRA